MRNVSRDRTFSPVIDARSWHSALCTNTGEDPSVLVTLVLGHLLNNNLSILGKVLAIYRSSLRLPSSAQRILLSWFCLADPFSLLRLPPCGHRLAAAVDLGVAHCPNLGQVSVFACVWDI